MKIPSLFLVFAAVCASTEALQQTSLRGGHATRLEAHAHQVVHTAEQHHDSPEMAKMEAKAHQTSAKAASSIKKQYFSPGNGDGYMMEAKSATNARHQVARMEAHAHQNSAKTSAKAPKMEAKAHQHSVKSSNAKMEAKGSQLMISFQQAVRSGHH